MLIVSVVWVVVVIVIIMTWKNYFGQRAFSYSHGCNSRVGNRFLLLFWKRKWETNPEGTRIQGPKVYETTLYLVMIIKCPPRSWVERRSKQHSHSEHQSPNRRFARAILQIFCGQQFHFFISLLVESLKRTNLISFCVPLKNPTFSCITS